MNCDYISGLEHVLTAYKDFLFNLCHLPLSLCVTRPYLSLSDVFVATVKQSTHKHAVEFNEQGSGG